MRGPPSFGFRRLTERARTGDQAALAELWSTYQPRLLRYLRGRGCRDPEDLASVVWVQVAEALGRFAGDEVEFAKLLFTIARRRHIDQLRVDSRRPTVPIDESHDQPTEDAETADLERALRLIRTLPEDMADAVLLRYMEDLDASEIAAIIGTSPGNVRVLLHRGIERLNRAIGAP